MPAFGFSGLVSKPPMTAFERTRPMRLCCAILSAVLLMAAAVPRPAGAHSSTTAEARVEVTIGPDRSVTALRHVWRFDKTFSATLLEEFDADEDLTLDDAELAEIAATIKASLADFNYFQLVTANGIDVALQPPQRLIADMEDGRLLVLFETKPRTPLKLEGTVDIGVFDPSFTNVFDFAEDSDLNVDGMPDDCTRSVIRPDVDAALRDNPDMLDDALDGSATGSKVSRILATRLEISCPDAEK